MNIFHHDELDNHIKAKVDKVSRLLLNEKTQNIKAIALNSEFGNTTYIDETVAVQIITDDSAVTSSRMLCSLQETETEITSSFAKQGIRFKFLQMYLLAKYKANKIFLSVSKSYPFS